MENGGTWMNMGGWDQNTSGEFWSKHESSTVLNFTTEWHMWQVSNSASSKDGSNTKSNMVRVKLLTASLLALSPALGRPSKSVHFGSRSHWKKYGATVTEGSLGADSAHTFFYAQAPPDPPVWPVLTEPLWTGSPYGSRSLVSPIFMAFHGQQW